MKGKGLTIPVCWSLTRRAKKPFPKSFPIKSLPGMFRISLVNLAAKYNTGGTAGLQLLQHMKTYQTIWFH